jgi:hypothetical protein
MGAETFLSWEKDIRTRCHPTVKSAWIVERYLIQVFFDSLSMRLCGKNRIDRKHRFCQAKRMKDSVNKVVKPLIILLSSLVVVLMSAVYFFEDLPVAIMAERWKRAPVSLSSSHLFFYAIIVNKSSF